MGSGDRPHTHRTPPEPRRSYRPLRKERPEDAGEAACLPGRLTPKGLRVQSPIPGRQSGQPRYPGPLGPRRAPTSPGPSGLRPARSAEVAVSLDRSQVCLLAPGSTAAWRQLLPGRRVRVAAFVCKHPACRARARGPRGLGRGRGYGGGAPKAGWPAGPREARAPGPLSEPVRRKALVRQPSFLAYLSFPVGAGPWAIFLIPPLPDPRQSHMFNSTG